MHISMHNAIHQTDPLIMPRSASRHLISVEKVHSVKSKIHPQNTLSCLSDTVQSLSWDRLALLLLSTSYIFLCFFETDLSIMNRKIPTNYSCILSNPKPYQYLSQ
jgi:hypothetical protein